jgi:hypothetical protein
MILLILLVIAIGRACSYGYYHRWPYYGGAYYCHPYAQGPYSPYNSYRYGYPYRYGYGYPYHYGYGYPCGYWYGRWWLQDFWW